jgi:hypothetical protein
MLTRLLPDDRSTSPTLQRRGPDTPRSYRAELPLELLDEQGVLLDWLIDFTFDTLGADHLELRITDSARHADA